jgi:hypothetical protein
MAQRPGAPESAAAVLQRLPSVLRSRTSTGSTPPGLRELQVKYPTVFLSVAQQRFQLFTLSSCTSQKPQEALNLLVTEERG